MDKPPIDTYGRNLTPNRKDGKHSLGRVVTETRMDRLTQFLTDLRKFGLVAGQFRGLVHVLIGRRIETADGTLVSPGQTWRGAAALLKRHRFDKKLARELVADTSKLPPRQRERYWYMAISQSDVDSVASRAQGDQLAAAVKALGYTVGPAPFAR